MYILTFLDRKYHEEPQTSPTNPHKSNIWEVWWARESWKNTASLWLVANGKSNTCSELRAFVCTMAGRKMCAGVCMWAREQKGIVRAPVLFTDMIITDTQEINNSTSPTYSRVKICECNIVWLVPHSPQTTATGTTVAARTPIAITPAVNTRSSTDHTMSTSKSERFGHRCWCLASFVSAVAGSLSSFSKK